MSIETIIRKYDGALTRMLKRRLPKSMWIYIDDIKQDTYMDLMNHLDNIHEENVLTYLFNHSSQYIKQYKNSDSVPLSSFVYRKKEDDYTGEEQTVDCDIVEEEEAELFKYEGEDTKKLLDWLYDNKIITNNRRAVYGYFVDSKTIKDIARELKQSEASIRMIINRTLNKIREYSKHIK